MARTREDSLNLRIDRVVAAHYIENDADFLFRGISDDTWKMFYLENGALTANMGNGSQIVQERCAVFYGPGEAYKISACDEPSNLLILSFECSDTAVHKLRGRAAPISAAMRAVLQNILQELKHNGPMGTEVTSLTA